ncbi:MAG: cation:proton antiporter [Solirubrobacterales bacterium]
MHLADQLVALGGAFLVAALLARAGRRIDLPTIPLFILAGILLGPNTPGVVLFEQPSELKLLATLGLIFLLFYLGLEFSVDQITEGGKKLVATGAAYIAINVTGGFVFGLIVDWGFKEALVLAGVLGISSSAIATKLLVERGRMGNPETKMILGIIVIEDLFLALYLAVVTPIISGDAGTAEIVKDVIVGFVFLAVLACVARWGTRAVARLLYSKEDELLIVGVVGITVLVSGLAEELGVSDAIGAFMVGLIIGETILRKRVERAILPLRDLFGALFFFYFGLQLVPADVLDMAPLVAAAVALTMVLNWLAGVFAARLNEMGRLEAARISLTVFARGEFALILVSLAAGAQLDPRIASFTAGYVFVLAIIGPLMASRSKMFLPFFPARLFPAEKSVAEPA